jgi:diguanylate cyclase
MAHAMMIKDTENEAYYAKQAFSLMQKHEVAPAPENYAVWFHYAMAKNPDLIREVDNIINNSLRFTKETCSYLYNKYLMGNHEQKVIDAATHGAQKVLIEVLRTINDFASETKHYHSDVDHFIEDVSKKFEGTGIQELVKELIVATTGLRSSGERITKKLEESRIEISNLKKDLQEVTMEAQRDFLTGVLNRKTFEKLADEQMLTAAANQHELCLLMIDIDHFKQFNDRFGHLLGDEVLKTVARTLTYTLKGRDVVARFGGEEFIATLPETPLEGAIKVADMIRTSIASKQLKRKDTGETYGTITISVGVARFRPGTDTLPTLIKRADDALYKSKHNGRNQVNPES